MGLQQISMIKMSNAAELLVKFIHNTVNEAFDVKVGSTIKNIAGIRPWKAPGREGWFGGSEKSRKMKGQGLSSEIIPAGEEFKVVGRKGSELMVTHPSLGDEPMEVHINKFHAPALDSYVSGLKKARKTQDDAAKNAEPEAKKMPDTPEEWQAELEAAQAEADAAKQAYAAANKRVKIAQFMLQQDEDLSGLE